MESAISVSESISKPRASRICPVFAIFLQKPGCRFPFSDRSQPPSATVEIPLKKPAGPESAYFFICSKTFSANRKYMPETKSPETAAITQPANIRPRRSLQRETTDLLCAVRASINKTDITKAPVRKRAGVSDPEILFANTGDHTL